MLDQALELLRTQEIRPTTLVDIALTALLIYWLLLLIRGTRAVSLVIGLVVLYFVYVAAQVLGLLLLSQILQTGAVIGLVAVVVIFQPELRRALGRVGTLPWLVATGPRRVGFIAREIAQAASELSAAGHGALIVVERQTPLQDVAETGVMIHADLSSELLRAVFQPRGVLHDGAVIVREETILAAAVLLPMPETTTTIGRFGTRHRAAVGITEQTDAVAVVVSEETGRISLVEGGRPPRLVDGERLERRLADLLGAGRTRRPFRLPGQVGPAPFAGLRLWLRRRGAELQAHRR